MGAIFNPSSKFMTGAIPFDPIGSKVASKVDPLYSKHQKITALSHTGTEWDPAGNQTLQSTMVQEQSSQGTQRKRATMEANPHVSVASKSLLGQ